jgi:hypothetical protein
MYIHKLNDNLAALDHLLVYIGCRDPSIAGRVRSLRVHPCILDDFWDFWLMRCVTFSQRWRWRIKNMVNRIFRVVNNPYHRWHIEKVMVGIGGASSNECYLSLSFDNVIRGMIDSLPSFAHIYEFKVEDWGPWPIYDIRPFYDAAWVAFGSQLRKLSFTRRMETFADVFHTPSLHFPQLQEVSISFLYTPAGMTWAGATLRDVVAPFINRHRSTIRALSLTAPCSMDFPTLFESFCLFPELQRIALDFAFNDTIWSRHSGLSRFLRDHTKTLCHIDLGAQGFQDTQLDVSPSFRTWITQNASDEVIFCGLESLTIPTVHETDFDSVMLVIKNSIDVLTKLALVGRYLSDEEVQLVAATFSDRALYGNLSSLRLHVRNLAPWTLCFIDNNFPFLQELSVYGQYLTLKPPIVRSILLAALFSCFPFFCEVFTGMV